MSDYANAECGAEAPEMDTTTHVCGCGECEECAQEEWAAGYAARTSEEQRGIWEQISAARAQITTEEELPF